MRGMDLARGRFEKSASGVNNQVHAPAGEMQRDFCNFWYVFPVADFGRNPETYFPFRF
jgi:hypothetical protein